jgi:hypothetical protein
MMTHRFVPLTGKRNFTYIWENTIPVPSDDPNTQSKNQKIPEVQEWKINVQIEIENFFPNLILKVQDLNMSHSDIKMAVPLWEYASILIINQKL